MSISSSLDSDFDDDGIASSLSSSFSESSSEASEDEATRNRHMQSGSHEGWVMAVELAGSHVYSAGYDHLVKKWDISDNICVKVFTGHDKLVDCMKVHGPKDEWLITGSWDKTVRVWPTDGPKTKEHLILEGHTGWVTCIVCRGSQVWSGSRDKTIRQWNIVTGVCERVFKGHGQGMSCIKGAGVTTLALTRDYLVSGSNDQSVRLWAIQGPASYVLTGLDSPIRALATRGDIAVAGSALGVLRVWEVSTQRLKAVLRGHGQGIICQEAEITAIIICEDEKTLYSASRDSTVRTWELTDTGAICTRHFVGHGQAVLCMAIDFYADILYTGSGGSSIRVWNTTTGEVLYMLKGHGQGISCMDWSEKTLVTGSRDATVRVWDLATRSSIPLL